MEQLKNDIKEMIAKVERRIEAEEYLGEYPSKAYLEGKRQAYKNILHHLTMDNIAKPTA